MFDRTKFGVARGALLLTCLALFVIAVSARKFALLSRGTQRPPTVTNKTRSLRVTNIRQLPDGDFEITFVNESDKDIYAYTIVSAQSPTRSSMTVLPGPEPLAAGVSTSERIAAVDLITTTPTKVYRSTEVTLSALYLEGGTVEGDARDAEPLQRRMSGMKEQAILALDALRRATASYEPDTATLLSALDSEAAELSAKAHLGATSKQQEDGRAMVNERLSSEIKALRTANDKSNLDVKRRLAELTRYYERLATKL